MTLRNEKILASVLTSIVSVMAVYFVRGTTKEKALAGAATFILGIIISVVVINSEPEII